MKTFYYFIIFTIIPPELFRDTKMHESHFRFWSLPRPPSWIHLATLYIVHLLSACNHHLWLVVPSLT